MDFFLGIKGKDFVLVCADTSATQSVLTIKQTEDKLVPVDSHKLFALAGEAGDRVHFSEYIIANVKLYALRNETSLSTKAVANYTRGELATALRKSPYHCNLLLAGYDKETGPSLYWMDYLATLNKINTGGNGYGSFFALSICDRFWHPDLTVDEALVIMEKAIAEVKRRLVVAPAHYIIKLVDKNGITKLRDV